AVQVADLVDLDDVGVAQAGDGEGLLVEAAQLGGGVGGAGDHLDGDGPLEADLAGVVDDAHAAVAELAEDLVAGDAGPPGPAAVVGRGGGPLGLKRGGGGGEVGGAPSGGGRQGRLAAEGL